MNPLGPLVSTLVSRRSALKSLGAAGVALLGLGASGRGNLLAAFDEQGDYAVKAVTARVPARDDDALAPQFAARSTTKLPLG